MDTDIQDTRNVIEHEQDVKPSHSSNLKQWLQRGDLDRLENLVLEGKGARLLGESSSDLRTRVFLKGLPNYLTKIAQIHNAVQRGSLSEVQKLVSEEPKKKLINAKDPSGTPLIHKAVYYDHQNILEWILKTFPATVQQKDREGRIPLHYCIACRDPDAIWDILVEHGSDASVCDKKGNPAAYYLQRGSDIDLPDAERMTCRKPNLNREGKWSPTGLDFKPSNIRIWIHNKDIGKLQQVLWEGHGSKLRCETSNNPRVKKFLEAVPFIMGTIRDIHAAAVKNDLEIIRKTMEEPISPIILCSKDSNGLTALHKAAGLGFVEIAREILERYPGIANAQDHEGRTPLHYAAISKDNGVMYDMLIEYGADETMLDKKQKLPAYYKTRGSDIDMTNLVLIPDAPRVSGTYPKHWDWRIIETDEAFSRAMKRTPNSTEFDSAFGSAESSKITEDLSPEMKEAGADTIENTPVEEMKKGLYEENEVMNQDDKQVEGNDADGQTVADVHHNEEYKDKEESNKFDIKQQGFDEANEKLQTKNDEEKTKELSAHKAEMEEKPEENNAHKSEIEENKEEHNSHEKEHEENEKEKDEDKEQKEFDVLENEVNTKNEVEAKVEEHNNNELDQIEAEQKDIVDGHISEDEALSASQIKENQAEVIASSEKKSEIEQDTNRIDATVNKLTEFKNDEVEAMKDTEDLEFIGPRNRSANHSSINSAKSSRKLSVSTSRVASAVSHSTNNSRPPSASQSSKQSANTSAINSRPPSANKSADQSRVQSAAQSSGRSANKSAKRSARINQHSAKLSVIENSKEEFEVLASSMEIKKENDESQEGINDSESPEQQEKRDEKSADEIFHEKNISNEEENTEDDEKLETGKYDDEQDLELASIAESNPDNGHSNDQQVRSMQKS